MKRLKTQQEQWNVTRRDMPSVEVMPIFALNVTSYFFSNLFHSNQKWFTGNCLSLFKNFMNFIIAQLWTWLAMPSLQKLWNWRSIGETTCPLRNSWTLPSTTTLRQGKSNTPPVPPCLFIKRCQLQAQILNTCSYTSILRSIFICIYA